MGTSGVAPTFVLAPFDHAFIFFSSAEITMRQIHELREFAVILVITKKHGATFVPTFLLDFPDESFAATFRAGCFNGALLVAGW